MPPIASTCPTCHIALTPLRGAHFRCPRCGNDYGLFRKRAPYSGIHRTPLTTPAQIRMAEAEEYKESGNRP